MRRIIKMASIKDLKRKDLKKAAFGAGCFWHVEEDFRTMHGIINTTVGFMGGKTKNPTYKEVCYNNTGHIETALVEYDSKKISYDKILDKFFEIHNPTSKDRQGLDFGVQYRSAIFYYDDKQKIAAEKKIEEINASKKYRKPIVTVILKAEEFYKAEEYHQKYLMKKGLKNCSL